MLAPTYAKLKNIDPNDAYRRLTSACRDYEWLDGLQQYTWEALKAARPEWEDETIVDRVEKKLSKSRRYRAATWKAAEEGAWIAWSVLVDQGAGVASGEALDLIETPVGQQLLQTGFELVGAHLAKEMLR